MEMQSQLYDFIPKNPVSLIASAFLFVPLSITRSTEMKYNQDIPFSSSLLNLNANAFLSVIIKVSQSMEIQASQNPQPSGQRSWLQERSAQTFCSTIVLAPQLQHFQRLLDSQAWTGREVLSESDSHCWLLSLFMS